MDTLIHKLIVGALGVGLVVNSLLTASPKPNAPIIPYTENEPKTEIRARSPVSDSPKSRDLALLNKQIRKDEESIEYELKLENWLKSLRWCESRNNDLAINPKDRNGKRSVGRYQFQDLTWEYFVREYDLFGWQNWDKADWQNSIWDGEWQEKVLRMMLRDKSINWRQQFPDCVKKYGLPPKI